MDVGLAAVGGGGFVFYGVEEILYGRVHVLAVLLLAITIDVGVAHDRSRPALEVGTDRELIAVLIGPQVGLLHQVLRIFVVAGQLQGEGEENVVEAADLGEELLIGHNESRIRMRETVCTIRHHICDTIRIIQLPCQNHNYVIYS